MVQVARRNPVILRTKVFPTSSNFRQSRRSSFERPSGMLAIWKSTLGGCRPSDKGAGGGGGGGGGLGASVWAKKTGGGGGGGGPSGLSLVQKYVGGGGGVRGLTWIRHWSKLLFLMQSCCFSPALWSLLFTIQLFYSQNTETETNDNTRGKLDKATVFTDTAYEIKTCPSRRFFPFVWLKRDRYGTRT